jgi:very-short-patch-repair endonuclease
MLWRRKPTRTARTLRKTQTDAEPLLWTRLRHRGLAGRKFRRQVPIGAYVVDFACLEENLVIEIDGGQHAERADKDEKRTAWLEGQGLRVVRFRNNEVLGNIEGVLMAIEQSFSKPTE